MTLLMLLSCVPALFAQPSREAAERIVYTMPVTVPAVLAYVADEKGFWKAEGLEVVPKMFSSGREALQALLAKGAEVMSVSETPPVHAILQGNEIVCVATIAEHIEAKLIARKDRGILKPEDLAGKRVATLPGTNSDYFMYRFLDKHRIPLEKVRIANMPPPEMVVAYAKGDIDAYFAWEPHITYGRRQLPEQSLVFYPGELYRGRTTVIMNKDYVAGHPDVVRKLIRGLLRAEWFVRKNPEEAIALVAARLKMDPPVLRELWKESVFKVELDEGLLPLLEEVGRWATERSGTGKPLPDFRDYIYADALRKARPYAVHLGR
jgi:NitT/TauT family transport system substrate-binding protein